MGFDALAQRRAALEKAVTVRKVRAQMRGWVRAGVGVERADVVVALLLQPPPELANAEVGQVVGWAFPPRRAGRYEEIAAVLAAADIRSGSKPVRTVTARQAEAIGAALGRVRHLGRRSDGNPHRAQERPPSAR